MVVGIDIDEALAIDGVPYRVAEHPAAPGTPYGQEGQHSVVYQVVSTTGEKKALKAFKREHQLPSQLLLVPSLLADYAGLPGLSVCQRSVLTKRRNSALLYRYPDLAYAMLMPWIEGPTWMAVLRGDSSSCPALLTPQQSLAIARSLAGTLARMHQHGLAHCDLSASNLLIPGLCQSALPNKPIAIELVDLEQLYGPSLPGAGLSLPGSPGYALHSAPKESRGDRFAGAVLLAEMLGWCDEGVRAAAWGESYFDPEEMQQETERYKTLVNVLRDLWGETVAGGFRQAWHGTIQADCPSSAEWMVSLLEAGSMPQVSAKPELVLSAPEATIAAEAVVEKKEVVKKKEAVRIGPFDTVRDLIRMAQQFEDTGQPASALETYRQALQVVTRGGLASRPLLQELELVVGALEVRQRQDGEVARSKPIANILGPSEESVEQELAALFDESLALYEQGDWQQAKELLKEREVLSEIVERRTGAKIDQQRATQVPEAQRRQSNPGRGRQPYRDAVPLVVASVIVLTVLGIAGYLFLLRGDEDMGGDGSATLASVRDAAASQTLAAVQARARETGMAEARATDVVRERETSAAQILATATAQAYGTATAQTHEMSAGQTATARAYEAATIAAHETTLAWTVDTATAAADEAASAAQARETGTAQALATGTAEALAATTAGRTATAQSQLTATVRAPQIVAAQTPEITQAEAPVIQLEPASGRVGTPITVAGYHWPDQSEVFLALAKGSTMTALSRSDKLDVSIVPKGGFFETTIQLPEGEDWEKQPKVAIVAYTFDFTHFATAWFTVIAPVVTATSAEIALPSLEVGPGQVSVGATLTVTGTHWTAGSTVHLTVVQLPKSAETLQIDPEKATRSVTADARGTFEAQIMVPEPEAANWEDEDNLVLVGFASEYQETATVTLKIVPLSEP